MKLIVLVCTVVLVSSLAPVSASAAPEARQRSQSLFLSPMGEPFRAPINEAYPSRQWFDRADANHDGALTREEFVADGLRFFEVLEADGAGFITDGDVTRYEHEVVPELTRLKSGDGDDVMVSEGGVGSGHHRGGADPYSSGGRAGGQGVPRHSDEPTGQINATTRRDERPEGAALFSVLPFPEPVTSARSFYGQRITREVFADAASKRFDLLTGKATVLKYADLPLTPVQPRTGLQK